MKYRVKYAQTARQDMRDISAWLTRRGSRAVALKWSRELRVKVTTLKEFPLRCPLAAESENFPVEIRELLDGGRPNTYRILFTVEGETVNILYVHHAAREELEA